MMARWALYWNSIQKVIKGELIPLRRVIVIESGIAMSITDSVRTEKTPSHIQNLARVKSIFYPIDHFGYT
jgi:hypothetical protein